MIKKADIILAAVLIAAGLLASYYLSFGKDAADQLVITVDGEKFGSYNLIEDKEIAVDNGNHINKVTINNGIVSMKFSTCKGQDCVHQRAISSAGDTIICLPNKVVLEISGKDASYDSVSK